MKTSRQDIQDLLSQLAADIEEIKAMLNVNRNTAGAGAAGNPNAISNDVAANNPAATDFAVTTDYATAGNGSAAANADQIIAETNRLLEPIAQTCGKLSGRLKSYYSQLLLRIPKDLREELNRDNETRKRKGLPTIENKIDNSLTMLVSIYDRLNQLEDALLSSRPKLRIVAWLKSALSGVQRLRSKRKSRWYRNPYILCAIVIYLLYFGLSIFSWQQWQRYRDENTRLRLAANKYHVDSVILHKIYPQAAITLSAYEHITESKDANAAIEAFRENINAANSKSK